MELLSPAGSFESLIAAVQSGADAVYLGGSKFGARQSAVNFEIDEMKKWIDYCHLYDVKVYVTVNTLVKDSEMQELAGYVRCLNDINADGVIVQDFGVVEIIRAVAPELPIHASTQMTATSLSDVQFLERMGITRVVLSRELCLEEIRRICENTECEIEVFVHGALCMSYSGQCLMSSILGGRSGNRGRCAQPCRLPYSVSGTDANGYLLSPKDLCLVNSLKALKDAGVASLKIEGRLKRAGYVSTVVGIYRKCLDNGSKADNDDMKALSDAFGRGFTTGFFGGEQGKRMMNQKNSSNAADNVFSKAALDRCKENADFRKVPVTINAQCKTGEPLCVTICDEQMNTVTGYSESVSEKAQKAPTGKERLEAALTKLGGTPYKCVKCDVEIDEDAVIPVSAINFVRRFVCDELSKIRIYKNTGPTCDYVPRDSIRKHRNVSIMCDVYTKEQLEAVRSMGITDIVAHAGIADEDCMLKCPPVSKSVCKKGNSLFVSALGQLELCDMSGITGSHRLNITNSLSADFYSSFVSRSLLSCELSLREIRDITSRTELECGVIGYGRLDLMLCANCPLKAAGKCQNGEMKYSLRDRKGESFPVVCTDDCAARILNSKPLYMADKWNDFTDCGISFVCLVFTTESGEECRKILGEYIKASNGEQVMPLRENTFTRGHFYRGIL